MHKDHDHDHCDCGEHGHDHHHGHDHDHDHDHSAKPKPGKCFQAVLEAASENEDVEVVNAWVLWDGEWVVHAWVEGQNFVLDFTVSRDRVMKEDYYKALSVSEDRLKRYSRVEFFTLMAENSHFGPYDKDFFFDHKSDGDPLEVIGKG